MNWITSPEVVERLIIVTIVGSIIGAIIAPILTWWLGGGRRKGRHERLDDDELDTFLDEIVGGNRSLRRYDD